MEDNQVEKIIEYLQGKIAHLKERLAKYDSPIMQDMAKNSTHLQMDYIRLSSELQANEDNLLAIQKFSTPTSSNQNVKPVENGKQKAGGAGTKKTAGRQAGDTKTNQADTGVDPSGPHER